jgi:hypothetical protein
MATTTTPEHFWNMARSPDAETRSLPPIFPMPALVIAAAAFAVVFPFLFLGNASGHDFEFHVLSWMEVVNQWKQGVIYPRWAEFAHYAYGEARFLFYPPASWILGAVLGALLPWKMASGAYVFCALSASGSAMFLLARRFLSRNDAVFAAALYAANPYYIVIIYWRSALAELLAGCLLPLLFLVIVRDRTNARQMVVPASLVVAAAWLTNAPSAVMVNYSLALLILIVAFAKRQPKLLFYGGLAVLLGAALAGFYLIPAILEEKWVNIAEVLAPGLRPQDNFLFTLISDVEHNQFNLLVSLVGASEAVLFTVSALVCRRWRNDRPVAWRSLGGWGTVATLLMTPITGVLWQHLPKLRFVQLPWRWLLCLNVAFAMLVTIAFRRWIGRAMIYCAMLAVVWIVWHKVQEPWWDNAADIRELHDFIEDGAGYEGVDEYVPTGVDASGVNQRAPLVATVSGRAVKVAIQEWVAETRVFTAETVRPEELRLRLFNYPAWRAFVNGKAVVAFSQPHTGELLIPVHAGRNEIRVAFARTRDRLAGGLCSGAGIILLLLWRFRFERQPTLESVRETLS